MLRLLFALFSACLVAGCFKEAPSPAAIPEVNDSNCLPEAIKRLPEATRKQFAGLCLRRGRLDKGSDQGLRP